MKDYLDQIETQFYCKLLDLNSVNFEYSFCNFSRRHMRCKVKFLIINLTNKRIETKVKQKQDAVELWWLRSLDWYIHTHLSVGTIL